MKAAILPAVNEPLQIRDIDTPTLEANEVLVQIRAAALNHRDNWIKKGLYAGIKYPVIPGSDGSGIVNAVGSKVSKELIGKEVIINPSLNWGNDERAQQKAFQILGLPTYGTFAEFVKIPVEHISDKPAHLSFEEAAALPLAGLTAFRALFIRAKMQAGEKLFITGIGGGVALFALQFGVAAGVTVYVSSGDDAKIDKAIKLGAKAGVNYHNENWVQQLQEVSGGVDIIIDGAAGKSFLSLLEVASPGARIVNYGATLGDVPSFNLRRIFWKQLNLLGSTMGSPSDFKKMIDFVAQHKIRPVVDEVFNFDKAAEAMEKMNDGRQFGKIVVRINP